MLVWKDYSIGWVDDEAMRTVVYSVIEASDTIIGEVDVGSVITSGEEVDICREVDLATIWLIEECLEEPGGLTGKSSGNTRGHL